MSTQRITAGQIEVSFTPTSTPVIDTEKEITATASTEKEQDEPTGTEKTIGA